MENDLMTADPIAALPAEITDEGIVRRVVAGERELFELLLRRYNQRIYRAVRAVLRNPDDVEDVMQQAYINAYRYLGQFEGRSAFATWLTKIAIREAAARNRKSVSLDGEDMVIDFPKAGPRPGSARRRRRSDAARRGGGGGTAGGLPLRASASGRCAAIASWPG
jgi:DNA-directed RNA polymerase specialized sigma24 family protein